MTNLFKVDGQTLTPIETFDTVSESVNYLTYAFTFSFDWDVLTKSAIFTKGASEYEVVLVNDAITADRHVNLSAGEWTLSVVGSTVVDAVVTKQITTTPYTFTVTQADAVEGEMFPPSIASQVYVNVNQATPQTFVGGIPKLAADRVIDLDNELADKKYVDDKVATVTADDFNHNDLSNKQGGTTNEFYHVTAAEKTVIQNTSGTNTGDQDVSGAISTHNSDATAHTVLARKIETMRLLISRTIGAGENVSAITWTQDDAGNALALIDMEIRTYVPSNSIAVGSNGVISARFNGYSNSGDYYSATSLSSSLTATYFRSLYGHGRLVLNRTPGNHIGFFIYDRYDGTAFNSAITQQGTIFYAPNINNIYLYIAGLTYFPDGTVIQIYGRTA